jgi:hypothetical protein
VSKSIFISADHGTAIIYFLQSDVVPRLLEAGLEVIVLTDDDIKDEIAARFEKPGLRFEGLRLGSAGAYARRVRPRWQWLLAYLRRVGGSWQMNTAAMDSHVWEVWTENSWRFRVGMWLPAAAAIVGLRASRRLRRSLVALQQAITPNPGIYGDLFEKYQPSLVLASTAGWRLDRYLLREAHGRGVRTATAIVGWDNPSSYAVPGAEVDWVTCWSELQKKELVVGSDWQPRRVHIGGIPSYDGYLTKAWQIPRSHYFVLHGLDPHRKLISYACSFVHFAPNLPNVRALANLVANDMLEAPAQLLVRLHPSHFQDKPRMFADERKRIEDLEHAYPHVHVVKPVPLGGSLGYYGGEDMDEKASMMAHSDVLVTVYSTMLVETAIHDTPMVAAVLDVPGGWNVRRKYSLPLRQIGNWPTHRRFRDSGAGRVADTEDGLRRALNLYLANPKLDGEARLGFAKQEITYLDGSAGRRTADFILGLLEWDGRG